MPCQTETPSSVDAYIAGASAAVRPICETLRRLIRQTAPELHEVIKWSFVCYKGTALVCGFGAFKGHVSLMFFRGAELDDSDRVLAHGTDNASSRSVKFTTADQIKTSALTRLLKAAMKLDTQPARRAALRPRRSELPMPQDLALRLKTVPRAEKFFAGLPPSHRREYIEWITTAKRPETRERRLVETVKRLSSGRRQNEQYRAKK
jgi:uncharacterized protein YdeI (YjbR/CyaY-like superfamily)